jgi:CRP/FNR family transcriptional regulator, cyclic AMP receptor protein
LIARFQGDEGRRLLAETLRAQRMICACAPADITADLLDLVTLREISRGETLLTQGDADNDMYFVLAGAFSVLVNGREIARRSAGQHIGEMALVDPSACRSATAVCTDDGTVVARISEPNFSRLAERFPSLWRVLAVELSSRLRERGRFLQAPNPRARIFLGSSSEALPVATALRDEFASEPWLVRLWTDGVFNPSRYVLEDLVEEAAASDFSVLVLAPDDKIFSRWKLSRAPRDNLVFELGLFMGALGRERTVMVLPKSPALKIPTDLLGLTQLRYAASSGPRLAVALAPVCAALRTRIASLGPK